MVPRVFNICSNPTDLNGVFDQEGPQKHPKLPTTSYWPEYANIVDVARIAPLWAYTHDVRIYAPECP